MRYRALATDYDGTLASGGAVAEETVDALMRLRWEGCKLILVTGREVEDLHRIFPDCAVFDLVVAENGAVLYFPETEERKALAPPPSELLLRRLAERQVRFGVGMVIVATTVRFRREVKEVIEELQLDVEVILNKEALMVLPRGIHKGSGLKAALELLSVEWRETVGIGDAENDLHFLSLCGYAVATGNALQVVREKTDAVMTSDNGASVREVAEMMLRINRKISA